MPKCLNCFPNGYDWKGKGNIHISDDASFPEHQLPEADFLVITWTKEETHALTKVPAKKISAEYLLPFH